MIYTPMTNSAMKVAYRAHHGQLDCNGIPYIFHPFHLAESMDDEVSCCVALLHDVLEDTNLTPAKLRAMFPRKVTDAVELLTHQDGVDYFDYVRAIRENPIARKVKLADLAHNSDQSRCVGCDIPEEKLQHWREKYAEATRILTEE